MEISTKLLLVVATLLLAVNLSDAQNCPTGTQRTCITSTAYITCNGNGVIAATACTTPVAGTAVGCAGTGTPATICFAASCPQGPGNNSITSAPNSYYFCGGTAAAPTFISVASCPSGVNFDRDTRLCVVPPTPPGTPPAAPTNPVTCTGQTRLPDPTSCNHFYVCAGATSGTATRTRCPLKMRYDIATSRCRIRFLTNCGTRPETSG